MRTYFIVLLTLVCVGCRDVSVRREAPTDTDEIQRASYETGETPGRRGYDGFLKVSFDKRYDLYCALFSQSPTVYRNCRILGLTGVKDDHDSNKLSKHSIRDDWHEGMLVLELPDGRRVYLPPARVKYFEETSPMMRSSNFE